MKEEKGIISTGKKIQAYFAKNSGERIFKNGLHLLKKMEKTGKLRESVIGIFCFLLISSGNGQEN